MVESDDDFTELCSKLLKRVKKNKPAEGPRGSTASAATAAKRKAKRPKASGSKSKASNGAGAEPAEPSGGEAGGAEKPGDGNGAQSVGNGAESVCTGPGPLSTMPAEKDGDAGETHEEGDTVQEPPSMKHLILERMQQYKRASPIRMKLNPVEVNGEHESFGADTDERTEGDSAVGLHMNLRHQPVSLEDEGFFFCQLCHRDLTTMSSTLRQQHVNRCLDQGEGQQGGSVASGVPSCPLCGKPFTTEKSRAAHLKRCAAKLEVPAQTLLQAVQRQATETGTEPPARVANVKRKAAPKQKEPSKRRKVAKTGAEMEDLMVAMALSRSMQAENITPITARGVPTKESAPPGKKSRRKQKDKPTPLLLVQAPEEAVQKLQKRMSMLLSEEPPGSELITLPASHFWSIQEEKRETWSLRAGELSVFWDISNMMETRENLSYYTAELNPPITPWNSASKRAPSSQTRTVTPVTPVLPERFPVSLAKNDKISPATPCKEGIAQSDSQKEKEAIVDLMELAREGMTLTQWNSIPSTANNQTGRESPSSIACSGFIPAEEEPKRETQCSDTNTNALMALTADFMEMVNNPHLSDVQLQTDCGEVLNGHMFVLYARCPLLVEAVHTEGFWVDEVGTGRVKRLLVNDVSAEAAMCFLRFLYSAKTDIPSRCLIHVCELARRFGVRSLLDTCEVLVGNPPPTEDVALSEEEEDDGGERAENFLELLKSMWVDEDEGLIVDPEAEGVDEEGKVDDGRVGEVDLEEIYEFAATQRRLPEVQDTEGGSSSEFEGGYQGSVSKESTSLNRSQVIVDGEEVLDTANQKSAESHILPNTANSSPSKLSAQHKDVTCSPLGKTLACLDLTKLESSPEEPLLASPAHPKTQLTPITTISPLKSPSKPHCDSSKHLVRQLFDTEHSKPSESPSVPCSSQILDTISLLSPEREEDPEADLFTPHITSPLDDSYDRMFSETCGEYVEPSDLCETNSRTHQTTHHQSPTLTSSPLATTHSTLPKLVSSPSIQSPKPSCSQYSSSTSKIRHSPVSSSKSSASQSSCSKTSSTALSQRQDIILILSSDEEDSAEVSEVGSQGNRSAIIKATKESPASFSIRRRSEGHSCLQMSSSSETSWLVPATPMPHTTGAGVSQLQSSHKPQSPRTPDSCSHNESRRSFESPAQRSFVSPTQKNLSPVLPANTTKTSMFSNRILFPRTPEKPTGSCSSTDNKASCVRSPRSSVASSAIFEVVDSDEEGPVEEPQANNSACSIQIDYDEPPIPVEDDLWINTQETPAKSPANPQLNASLHMNATPTKTPEHSCSTTKSQEKDDEELEIKEDSPSTTPASNSSQRSYLNSKLWDEWEEEEPELPEILPLTQRLTQIPDLQKELRTPVSMIRKREVAQKVPITPLPDYSDMETPLLKKELNRFGVRALPKKKMVLKLKEIFRYTHQVMSSDSEEDVPSSQPNRIGLSSGIQHPHLPAVGSTQAPAAASKSGSTQAPAAASKSGSTQAPAAASKSGSTQASAAASKSGSTQAPAAASKSGSTQAPAAASKSGSTTLPDRGKKTASVCAPQEEDSGDDQPLMASQDSTTSSVAASDTSSLSHSSNTNEFETAFADDDDDDPVPASQAANKEEQTAEAVRRFIEGRPDLHKRILLYQPLDLSALHAELKQSGIKMAAGKLLDYLDAHCITFTTAAARKEKKSRGRRKAGKRH